MQFFAPASSSHCRLHGRRRLFAATVAIDATAIAQRTVRSIRRPCKRDNHHQQMKFTPAATLFGTAATLFATAAATAGDCTLGGGGGGSGRGCTCSRVWTHAHLRRCPHE